MIDNSVSIPSAPSQAPASATPGVAVPAARVMAVDALRGFDMFWIVGGDAVVLALANLFHNAVTRLLEKQCEHVKWEGFVFQ